MPAPATTKGSFWCCSPTTRSVPWTGRTAPVRSAMTAMPSPTAISRPPTGRWNDWRSRLARGRCQRRAARLAKAILTAAGGCRGRRSISTPLPGPPRPRRSASPACRRARLRSCCASRESCLSTYRAPATARWRSAPSAVRAPWRAALHSGSACRRGKPPTCSRAMVLTAAVSRSVPVWPRRGRHHRPARRGRVPGDCRARQPL